MKRKILALILVAALSVATTTGLTGCKTSRQDIDPTRTQLYIQNFDGGYGSEWLRAAKLRFEETEKENSYEDGKTGVQIMITGNKEGITTTSMGNTTQEVFFGEKIYYNDLVTQKQLLDITDVVTEKLTAYNEDKTVESKLTQVQKDYLKIDGKYYGIPHYEGYSGIQYDVDLFENEGLYFSEAGPNNGNGGFVKLGENKRPGKYGFDDGLPVTYDEFFKLCDRMVENGITPFIWPGEFQHYVNTVLSAVHADYEGLEQMMLNYTFEGTATSLISVDNATGAVAKLPDAEIENSTGHKLYAQAGRYYALKFIERIVQNTSYYAPASYNQTQSHMSSQEDFLRGRFTSAKPTVAMLLDGTWWINEATGVFDDMVEARGEAMSQQSRRFGFMPFPKAEGAKDGLTLYDNLSSVCFINAKIESFKIPLAKAFLRFCSTDESLQEFTVTTNGPRALSYELTPTQKEGLTHYGKQLIAMRAAADIVYPLSSNALFLDNQSRFTLHQNQWSTANNQIYPSNAMRAGSGTMTAAQYFNQMQALYAKDKWDNLFKGKYYS